MMTLAATINNVVMKIANKYLTLDVEAGARKLCFQSNIPLHHRKKSTTAITFCMHSGHVEQTRRSHYVDIRKGSSKR